MRIVDQATARLDAEMLAFCLMGNHYHFVIRTRQANLSRLMRQINGAYTQAFNKRHGLTGHVFQGRFHGVLIDVETHLLQACRYVELNPVRASMVQAPSEWPWSSYRAHVGLDLGHAWLATNWFHGYVLGRDANTADDVRQAIHLWASTVAAGEDKDFWKEHLRAGIFLGDDAFVLRMQAFATAQRRTCVEILRSQRTEPARLSDWQTPERTEQEAFRLAHTEGGMTMAEIGRQAELSASRVSRMIASAEKLLEARPDPVEGKT